MRQVSEAARSTPVLGETEVLVVGGGPGGLAAALGAARAGARTMLVDRYGCFGGVITQVGVESIAWYRHEGTVDAERDRHRVRAARARPSAAPRRSRSRTARRSTPSCSRWWPTSWSKRPASSRCCTAWPSRRSSSAGSSGGSHREQVGSPRDPRRAGRRCHRRRRHRQPRRRALPHRRAGAGHGRHRDVLLLRRRQARASSTTWPRARRPTATGPRCWQVETTGKEDALFSPYLQEPFDLARRAGVIPDERDAASAAPGAASPTTARRPRSTWS